MSGSALLHQQVGDEERCRWIVRSGTEADLVHAAGPGGQERDVAPSATTPLPVSMRTDAVRVLGSTRTVTRRGVPGATTPAMTRFITSNAF